MSSLNLSVMEKDDVQTFVETLQNANPRELNRFTMTFVDGNEAAWHRFIKGAYNHPITWWIGIFQLTMQMGIWGHHHRSVASARASILWQISEPLRHEVSDGLKGKDMPLLSAIVRYNLKHRKAVSEVMSLTQAAPGPVPIREFCSRPENINLKGVCR